MKGLLVRRSLELSSGLHSKCVCFIKGPDPVSSVKSSEHEEIVLILRLCNYIFLLNIETA